ncbi:VOC family protein [Tistrella bauzanensis]|uniref:VOC family protein n=1 Tax=Tistrella TaxID=171436 RepID=UPI0031F64662
MITGLAHVEIVAIDLDAATSLYAALFDRAPIIATAALTCFQVGRLVVRLMPGRGDTPDGLSAVGFAVDDLSRAAVLAERRGLAIDHAMATENGLLRLSPSAAGGLAVHLVQTEHLGQTEVGAPTDATNDRPGIDRAGGEPGAVIGLDHVVIRTTDVTHAVAVLGGRLGLDLRLDRTNPAWRARMLFFRCGDSVVEVVQSMAGAADPPADIQINPPSPHQLWGLCWRVADARAAHGRLAAAGIAGDAPRRGRRPATQVFTLAEPPAGVATLILSVDA